MLTASSEPCIVIAGAGMCEGGRILHHFREGLGNERNSIVIVGFMAQHTLGRRLVERRRQVKVFGVPRELRAHVHVLNGLSAHADRDDIVHFVEQTAKVGNLQGVALVHGETAARESLRAALIERGIRDVTLAKKGERIEL